MQTIIKWPLGSFIRDGGVWRGVVVMGLEKRTELRPVIEVYLTGLADGSDEKVEGKRKG